MRKLKIKAIEWAARKCTHKEHNGYCVQSVILDLPSSGKSYFTKKELKPFIQYLQRAVDDFNWESI